MTLEGGRVDAGIECPEEAREFGDRLVVALNSDASVTRLKGPKRPLVPEASNHERPRRAWARQPRNQ